MFYKLMFCCILSSLIVQVEVKAQKNNKIVYSDYGGYQADFLQVLKREGGVSSFTSMAVLKQHTKAVAENTVVPVHLRKAGEHMMEPTSMIEERKPSVLMVCKYIPATTQPDKVVFFASATVLSEDGVCLTNYHVLKSMIDEAVKLNRSDSILFVSTGPGKIYPISAILSYSKKGDMALFKIETGGDKLIPIPVGQDLAAGATVHTLTHPDEYLFFIPKE